MSDMDIDYTEMAETIFDAITGDQELDYEIAIAVFPKGDTIEEDTTFPAAIKTTA
jgi:hypothetical protein